jgi:HAL2 family 3'(2'),5'-bisphosphate nucleotidase
LGSELEALVQLRPGLKRLEVEDYNGPSNTFLWTAHRGEIQLDSATFEDYYLSGKVKLTDEETSMKWNDFMTYRLQYIGATKAMEDPSAGREEQLPLQVDNMAMELNAAVGAVQLASSMSRSLQKVLLQSMSASSKSDRSPVTVADFAVQALILDALHEKFPGDRFIAEEDSDILRNDEMVRTKVIEALISATGQDWSAERLFNAVDIGKYDGFGERVWVLDPVDGTKGFLRGEHYCIALGLMINMKPEVSVLGCPNLQLDKVLSSSDPKAVGAILGSREYALEPGSDASVEVYPPTAGSVYYAVSDLGAFARHLGMPLGAGYEVCTSMDGVQNPSSIVLCESTEASHGDRRVSTKVKDTLGKLI